MAFYKRSVFLINPSFQLRFSLVVCSLILISSMVYPLVMMDFFNEMVSLHPQLKANVESAKNEFILFLFVLQILFIFLVFILLVFMTHKVAGPIYKLKNHLSNIREGEEITPVVFRNGDHFQDLAEEVNLFLETILHHQEADFEYIDEVAIYIDNLSSVVPDDKKPLLTEITRRLSDIESRYKKPL